MVATVIAPAEVTTREVLDRAAGVLEERGWCQHSFFHRDGRVCAVGALAVACEQIHAPRSVRGDAIYVLAALTHCDPTVWNDTGGRTKEEVVGLLREAAENA